MPTVHVDIPMPLSLFYTADTAAALGAYAHLRVEPTLSDLKEAHHQEVLRGARCVFRQCGMALSGLRFESDYSGGYRQTLPTMLAVGGAVAANVLLGTPLTQDEIITALCADGFSASLTVACMRGGIQAAVTLEDKLHAIRLRSGEVSEVGIIVVEGDAPKPPSPTLPFVLTHALTHDALFEHPLRPDKVPAWFEAVWQIGTQHEIGHISLSGQPGTAILIAPGDLAERVEQTAYAVGKRLNTDSVRWDVLPLNRQGISISEYGAYDADTISPTPFEVI